MRLTQLLPAVALAIAAPAHAATDWAKVGQALGREGSVMPDGVYRVGLPRTDLKVTLDGVEVKPGLALGSWVAFQPAGEETMVMGDLVLTGEEVAPVMTSLVGSGIDVTALHNHLLRSQPMTMYLHIQGHGDPLKLASALHSALMRSATPMGQPAPPAASSLGFSQAAVETAVGAKGTVNGGILQFSIPRAEPVKEGGMTIPASMGSAIGINFEDAGGGKAAVAGDLVLTAKEVIPVVAALRAGGIEVVALHSHMLDEEPRLFFMHIWGVDEPEKLAREVRAGLDKVALAGAH